MPSTQQQFHHQHRAYFRLRCDRPAGGRAETTSARRHHALGELRKRHVPTAASVVLVKQRPHISIMVNKSHAAQPLSKQVRRQTAGRVAEQSVCCRMAQNKAEAGQHHISLSETHHITSTIALNQRTPSTQTNDAKRLHKHGLHTLAELGGGFSRSLLNLQQQCRLYLCGRRRGHCSERSGHPSQCGGVPIRSLLARNLAIFLRSTMMKNTLTIAKQKECRLAQLKRLSCGSPLDLPADLREICRQHEAR